MIESVSGSLFLRSGALFVATAIAEIVGCYLPYLWIRKQGSAWLVLPAVISLSLFVWLLTLHPVAAAGRTYAAYGGVYIAVALIWMAWVERVSPDRWDLLGMLVILAGVSIILLSPHQS